MLTAMTAATGWRSQHPWRRGPAVLRRRSRVVVRCVVGAGAAVIAAAGFAWAASPGTAQASDPVDLAVFPELAASAAEWNSEGSRVQLAGSDKQAWVAWCDDLGSWAQRTDRDATTAPIQLTSISTACPLEAFSRSPGSVIILLDEHEDDDALRTVRVTARGATTIDRVTLPAQVSQDITTAASSAGVIASYRVDPAGDNDFDYPIVAITADRNGNLSTVMRMSPQIPLGTPYAPVVAIDGSGRAVVCWPQFGESDPDGTLPFWTMCRTRQPGAMTFDATSIAWDARDLPVVPSTTNTPPYIDVEPQSVTIGADGSIGLLAGGDASVAAIQHGGTWTPPSVLAPDPTELDRSQAGTHIDTTGTLHAAWVTARSAPGGRSLQAAAMTPAGTSSSQTISQLPERSNVAVQMTPTNAGGAALLWIADRRHGGALRIATAPPGTNAFNKPRDRDTRPGRRSFELDVSPAPDRSRIAVIQHLVDASGTESGTAAIALMPAEPPSMGGPTSQPAPIAKSTNGRSRIAFNVRLGPPRIHHGTLTLRVLCRNALGQCTGHLTLAAKRRQAVSRGFKIRGAKSTIARTIRFSGVNTRRLLKATKPSLRLSARNRDGVVASAQTAGT